MAPTLPPALVERLGQIAQAARNASQGEKGAIYESACRELGIGLATLHRYLNAVSVRPKRKQRADAKDYTLPLEEAKLISAYQMEHIRKNGKEMKSLKAAVAELRECGEIVAGRIDPGTGEIFRLSDSAISRALYGYGLHLSQLLQPDPVNPMKSPHPNWCWQLDASLCVLYKLPVKGRRVEEIPSHEYYKNKLGKLAKVEHLLVQRYLITDHASGTLFMRYDLGGESAENLCDLLIQAVLERPGYPFHGAPNHLYVDRASANRSAMFRNLCQALGITLLYAQGARAKGQVEGSHNIWENGFESGIALIPTIATVSDLNQIATTWMHWFNGTQEHSRHGMTRYAAWQLIAQDQLRRVALDEKELRLLAREAPIERPVQPHLTVEYKGKAWDVSDIPGLIVGQDILVCRSAYDAEVAQVIRLDEEGREVFHIVHEKRREGSFRFFADAATVGLEHKRHADTPAQTARKELALLATGAATLEEDAAARKAKAPKFGDRTNPYQAAQEYQPPAWIPKKGADVAVPKPRIELPKLALPDLVVRLSAAMGKAWNPAEFYPRVKSWHPDGAAEAEIPALAERLLRGEEAQPVAQPPKLALVK